MAARIYVWAIEDARQWMPVNVGGDNDLQPNLASFGAAYVSRHP